MEIDIVEYKRGKTVNPQDMDDEEFTLVIDKANTFSYQIEDIEKKHSHVDFMSMASSRAAYRLAQEYDMEVLGYLSGYTQSTRGVPADTVNTTASGTKAVSTAGTDELLSSMKLNKGKFGNITTASAGDHSIPVAVRLPGATALPTEYVSPLMILSRMQTLMDKQYVPREGRWVVLSPDFIEVLRDEYSPMMHADWGESGALRQGDNFMKILGLRVYESQNLPAVGTGPDTTGVANQNSNYGVIVAGHDQSVATAEQINKTESFRSDTHFADVVRGLHVYGRKILRSEAITTAKWNHA